MWSSRGWVPKLALGLIFLLVVQGGHCEHEPTESECRPYIERALKDHHVDSEEPHTTEASIEQEENPPIDEQAISNEESQEDAVGGIEDEDGKTEETVEGEGVENKTDEDGNTQEENTEDNAESAEGTEGEDNNTQEEEDAEGTNEDTAEEGTDQAEGSQEDSVQGDTEEQADSKEGDTAGNDEPADEGSQEVEAASQEESVADEAGSQEESNAEDTESVEGDTAEQAEGASTESTESQEGDNAEGSPDSETDEASVEGDTKEDQEGADSQEGDQEKEESDVAEGEESQETGSGEEGEVASSEGDTTEEGDTASAEGDAAEEGEAASQEGDTAEEGETASQEGDTAEEGETASQEGDTAEEGEVASQEGDTAEEGETASQEGDTAEEETQEGSGDSTEGEEGSGADAEGAQNVEEASDDSKQTEEGQDATEEAVGGEASAEAASEGESVEGDTEEVQSDTAETSQEQETPEEDLTMEAEIPANLRPRDHITQILKLDLESVETETALSKNIDNTLKTLKNIYDNAIKPLELLFKYRDLSNRHFGDPEIFSKPLILFMGPWSGGKSSTINYLLDNEFTDMSLRTGAEPSPAYFNILMHGEEPEILDGTQLAADWTFSGLQKFGQGLLDRLRGVRLPNRLLEKVNIVEIPGILEIRKQVQRLFPFNDACQWFIDRADIIFLVYDPAKLDVGPETEAILDQLKGREYQTRIILNKADQVKPEELMRVQGTLIWNISPLMSSPEPPVMYTTSLWSLPYETGAPTRLLFAQERAFLRDLREAIDKRVDNKIASARRFAVRVRNHAKMVDCYLTTYYNHKTFFGNRKAISDDIIENPTKYHIYEGLSTLTNISRYDLPDPDMYRDFFRLNPLYEFTKLSDTCTYFRGCPINKLDVAIAYDLPELVGKYKKSAEAAKHSHS